MHSSTTFGEYYLAPMLAEFTTLNPRIQLDVSFDDRSVDLIAEASIWPCASAISRILVSSLAG